MSNLRELQTEFMAAIQQSDTAIESRIREISGRPSASNRIKTYRDSVQGNMRGALSDVFPVVRRLVGSRYFDAMVNCYVHENPMKSPDLTGYGAAFSAFIDSFEPAKNLSFLPDIARLEWAWHIAAFLDCEATYSLSYLPEIPMEQQEDIVFRLNGSMSRIESAFPVLKIWTLNRSDGEVTETVDLDSGGVKLAVWRQGADIRVHCVDDLDWSVLSLFAKSYPFSVICEAIEDIESAPSAAALLPRYLENQWITGFDLPS